MPCIPAMGEEQKGTSQQTQPWCPTEVQFLHDDNIWGLVIINTSFLLSLKYCELFKAMLGKGGKAGCVTLGALTTFSTRVTSWSFPRAALIPATSI